MTVITVTLAGGVFLALLGCLVASVFSLLGWDSRMDRPDPETVALAGFSAFVGSILLVIIESCLSAAGLPL